MRSKYRDWRECDISYGGRQGSLRGACSSCRRRRPPRRPYPPGRTAPRGKTHRRTGMPRAPGMSETPSAQNAQRMPRAPGTPGTARPAAWSRIRRAWRAGLRPTPCPGERHAAAHPPTGRATIRATVTAMPPDTGPPWIRRRNKPQPLPRYCPPSPRTRPAAGGGSSTASARNSARSTFPRRTSFWQGPTWRANRSSARWPPTCVIRSVSAPGRAPTVSTAAYTRGSGSPITASATAGSWATRLPSTSSRARASHASARWYRSTTSGISACRSDGNPTTRTTTAPTS